MARNNQSTFFHRLYTTPDILGIHDIVKKLLRNKDENMI